MNHLQPKLIQELSPLRKGCGMTPTKLRHMSVIRSIAARATATPVDAITDNQVYNFLLSELHELTHDNSTHALKNALGITSSHKKLSTRRLVFASSLGRHPDTVERYENQGISLFAAQLAERDLLLQSNNIPYHFSPLYLRGIESQAKATRTMTAIGLSSHLSLTEHTEELMQYLEVPRKPYTNATVHIALLPSSRGTDWYRFRLSYNFQGGRESFRIAVVLSMSDGEELMASGLIDDYHRLDNPTNPGRDIKTIISSSKFIMRNPAINTQKLLRFRELEPEQAARILESASRPLGYPCWLLEITIPHQWQSEECTYEYLSWINLQIASVAYWYSPTLMFLKKLTLDFSQFPQAHTREFFLLPFLGHAPGVEPAEKNLYILNLNNWIMPGHGIVLGWQDMPANSDRKMEDTSDIVL